ncbi:MAG: LysM peptidoglycan-binding domain-containing protein, partial [Ilumatobacteraceae bacterium]
ALPFGLLSIAERRFGGRAPWSSLDELGADVGSGSMTHVFDGWTISLRDSLMAEMVIRLVVTIGWAAVIAVAVTTLREVAHLANDPRRWVTSVDPVSAGDRRRVTGAPARAIAMGVLALLPAPASAFASRPMFTPAGWDVISGDAMSAHVMNGNVMSGHVTGDAGVVTDGVDSSLRGDVECDSAVAAGPSDRGPRVTEGATGAANIDPCLETHVVRAGESIYSIASDLVARAAGPEVGAPTSGGVTRVAGLLLDLNLGRAMSGDEVFESPAHIEPGWVLRLPDRDVVRGKDSDSGVVANSVESSVTGTVTVAEGDTLSGLVAEHLGSETDWREVYAWNAGREMGDGRTFDDPGLIIPGWELHLEPPGPATPGPEADADVVEVLEDVDVVDVEIVDASQLDVSDVDHVDLEHVDLEHVDPEPADLDQTDPEQADPDQADPEDVADFDAADSETADSDAADSGAVDSSVFRWLGAVLVGAGLLAGLRARRRRRLRALPSRPLPVRVSHEVSGSVDHDSSVDHDPSVEHGPAPSLERMLIAGDAQTMAPSLDAAVRSLVDLLLRNGPVAEPVGPPICSGIGLIEFAEDVTGSNRPRVHVELLDGRLDQNLDDPAPVAEPEWEVESSSRLHSLGAPEPVVGVFPMPLLVELGVRSTTT